MSQLRITLVRSPIGTLPAHRRTVRSLGLRKMNQSIVRPDSAAIRGMVRAVDHLVTCEEIT